MGLHSFKKASTISGKNSGPRLNWIKSPHTYGICFSSPVIIFQGDSLLAPAAAFSASILATLLSRSSNHLLFLFSLLTSLLMQKRGSYHPHQNHCVCFLRWHLTWFVVVNNVLHHWFLLSLERWLPNMIQNKLRRREGEGGGLQHPHCFHSFSTIFTSSCGKKIQDLIFKISNDVQQYCIVTSK